MKYPIIFLFSLLPAFLTSNQETLKPINIPVDIHEDFASLDDIMATLEGSVTLDEETNTYTYTIQGEEIKLNLNYGYSEVNGENEALFVEIDNETNLMTIKWVTPQLIDDEIYVPIQYIERVLDATYTDHAFTIQVKETVVEEEESDEEEELIREVTPEDEQETTKPLNTSKPNQIEQKPTQTPNTPNDVEQKPTPPVQTEEEQPIDEPTQTPIQPESKPEEQPKPPVEEDKEESEDSQPPIDDSEDFNPLPPINHPADSEKEEESESENSNEDLMLSDQVSQSEEVDN
ncbi:MAG: hypothetical protein J6D33_09505 [Turicibacter sp.]|nr:hypothetical protein [Turicibacter sp.]